MDLILYHGSCPDGWCAAYIAHARYPEAKLVPLDHGAEFDFNQVQDKDVLMLDFSLRTRELNDAIAKVASSFLILDHHKTAQAVLEGASYAIFDMTRSGAGLAWDFLFGKDSAVKLPIYVDGIATGEYLEAETYPRPWYVNYVEDRDLWYWNLPNSREICAYIGTYDLTIEAWDELAQIVPRDILTLGNGAVAHINHYVREAVKQAQSTFVPALHNFPVVYWFSSIAILNVPYLNCSEIGNELAKTHDISLTWFERGDGVIQFSLRSEGNKDISAFAKAFNGGGHRNAAGFQLSVEKGRELIDQILDREGISIKTRRSPGGCV